MELTGALSNIQDLRVLRNRDHLRGRRLTLKESAELASTPLPRRPGVLLETLKLILEQTGGQPLRAKQIHERAREILGPDVRWSSVKGTLAAHATSQRPSFERMGRGWYRISSRKEAEELR